jgi:uncharacterized protein (TIGR00369 family)
MKPAHYDAILYAGLPLAAAWGVRILRADAGAARLQLPAGPGLLRSGGIVSGPAIMGLADMAMWAALFSITESRDVILTTAMNITFLRPCGPGPLEAEARLIKASGRTLFGEVQVFRTGDGEPCAHVTSSWAQPLPR